MGILSPAGGTQGVFLQRIGGSVLASSNASFQYEPASSIKALIALYALTQVKHKAVQLTTDIPMVSTANGPDDCPSGTIPARNHSGWPFNRCCRSPTTTEPKS